MGSVSPALGDLSDVLHPDFMTHGNRRWQTVLSRVHRVRVDV